MKTFKTNGNGHSNGSSSSRKDELDAATKGATDAMEDAKLALARLMAALNVPSDTSLVPFRVGRGRRGDAD